MHTYRQAPILRSWGLLGIFALILSIFVSSCKKDDSNLPTLSTINELISTGSQFTLLKAAVAKAGFDATLSQPGTYTVFAPTDAAFKLLGYSDVNAINAAPTDLLKTILQYHVLSTRLASTDLAVGVNTPQQTLAGAPVYMSRVTSASSTTTSVSSSTISINGAHVLQADGQASNGVVYAIDRVLIPPAFGNVVATIQNIPLLIPSASFKLLTAAVAKTGAVSSLTAAGPITVFAPTDAAFKAVGYDSAAIAKATVPALTNILSYHLIGGRTYTPLITNGSSLTTLQGGTITAGISTTALTVTGKGNGGTASNITGPDITATNGVVHIIDRLLLPQ
ncbi:fasciclin domain-containing protein [Spirosoma aerolatum]|uniref:fasciclin domain-containing protein n=1 Tax=Spirosoma aerolatum TaxID=1211326 RepID=UPI0009AE7F43|nr:fasciclin domain-containing protein [Spirosoma aerolatum]